MTALEASLRVLSEAGEPLHYEEITRRALDKGYWQTQGKSPAATVSARLSTHVKLPDSPFERVAPGVYGLKNWDASTPSGATVAPRPQAPPQSRRMTFSDAAEEVLKHFANGQPMHYATITSLALEEGLVQTEGQTPEATMYAQIMTEIRRAEERDEQPRFTKQGRGLVGLTAWLPQGLAGEIGEHNRKIKEQLLAYIKEIAPGEFEDLVGRLLVEMGFEDVEVTTRHNDGGIDVRGVLAVAGAVRIRMAVQAKRWRGNVDRPVVQQVRGSLGAHEQGLIITTGGFSQRARAEAQRPDAAPVGLVDGELLVNLLVQHAIGVERTPYELLRLRPVEEISKEV